MKNTSKIILSLALALAFSGVQLQAQQINLTTQTKPKPTSPKQNYTLRTDADGYVQWSPIQLEVITGSTPPPGGPGAGQAPIFVSASGQVKSWNGSAWVDLSGADNWGTQTVTASYGLTGNGTSGTPLRADTTSGNGLVTQWDLTHYLTDGSGTKLNVAKSGYDWNGSLSENVAIRGQQNHSIAFDSISTFRVSNSTTSGTASNILTLVPSSSAGINISSISPSNANKFGNLQITLNAARLRHSFSLLGQNQFFADQSGLKMDAVKWDGFTGRQFFVDTIGYYFPEIETATSAFTHIVAINPSTGEIAKTVGSTPATGNALVWGGSGWNAGALSATNVTSTASGNIAAVNVQSAINELDAEKQVNVQYRDEGTNLGTSGTATTLDFTGSGVTATRSGNTVTVAVTGGGGGITTYSAGAGAIVTATGAGITFTRTTASQWTFSIPAGVELLSADVNNNASESATSAVDVDFVFAGSRPYNQDATAAMSDAKAPVVSTLEKLSPATYPTTAATNNPAWTASVTVAGTLRVSTSEFSEVGNGGANGTTILFKF